MKSSQTKSEMDMAKRSRALNRSNQQVETQCPLIPLVSPSSAYPLPKYTHTKKSTPISAPHSPLFPPSLNQSIIHLFIQKTISATTTLYLHLHLYLRIQQSKAKQSTTYTYPPDPLAKTPELPTLFHAPRSPAIVMLAHAQDSSIYRSAVRGFLTKWMSGAGNVTA